MPHPLPYSGFTPLGGTPPTGRPWSLAKRLHAIFEPGRYDVIHFHNTSLLGGPELMKWAKHTDAVTLYTVHDHWLVCPTHALWRNQQEAC